jgi:phosphatidylserine synthase
MDMPPFPQPPRKKFNYFDGPYMVLNAVMFFGILMAFTSTSPVRDFGIYLATYATIVFLLCLAGIMLSALKWLHYIAAIVLVGLAILTYLEKAAWPATFTMEIIAAVVAVTIGVLIDSIIPRWHKPPTPPPYNGPPTNGAPS